MGSLFSFCTKHKSSVLDQAMMYHSGNSANIVTRVTDSWRKSWQPHKNWCHSI